MQRRAGTMGRDRLTAKNWEGVGTSQSSRETSGDVRWQVQTPPSPIGPHHLAASMSARSGLLLLSAYAGRSLRDASGRRSSGMCGG